MSGASYDCCELRPGRSSDVISPLSFSFLLSSFHPPDLPPRSLLSPFRIQHILAFHTIHGHTLPTPGGGDPGVIQYVTLHPLEKRNSSDMGWGGRRRAGRPLGIQRGLVEEPFFSLAGDMQNVGKLVRTGLKYF